MRVVICDDSAFVRELLRLSCEDLGHQIVGEVSDGEEAIEVVMKLRPDLVFMDLVLPKKNGIESAKEIFQVMPKIKIVACTSLEQELMSATALKSGFMAYLTKPFSKKDIENLFMFFKQNRKEATGGRV